MRGSQGSDERTTVKEEEIDFPSCRHFLKNKNKNQAWMATVARHNLWLFDFRTARRWSAQKKKKKLETIIQISTIFVFIFGSRVESERGQKALRSCAWQRTANDLRTARERREKERERNFIAFCCFIYPVYRFSPFFYSSSSSSPSIPPSSRTSISADGIQQGLGCMCWCAESKVDSPCCK